MGTATYIPLIRRLAKELAVSISRACSRCLGSRRADSDLDDSGHGDYRPTDPDVCQFRFEMGRGQNETALVHNLRGNGCPRSYYSME